MLTRISTKNMSREEWLAKRRETIGGSDAGALLGFSKYSSPYALWCEKTGKIVPEDISDKEAVRLGNDLEDYVAARFMEKTGKKVRKDNHMIYNSDYPWAHANIDRAVVGEAAGLECKTTSSWEVLEQCRAGTYPETWYAQMTHYMMITGADRWYLGVLVLGKGFFDFTLERNETEIYALASAESDFWSKVTSDTPPGLDGSEATTEALKTIYRESRSGRDIDLTGVGSHISIYQTLERKIKELEQERDMHRSYIMDYMGEAEKGSYGSTSISWKSQERKTFDRKAFEAANGPIPAAYFKTSITRPFKVTTKN